MFGGYYHEPTVKVLDLSTQSWADADDLMVRSAI